MRGALQGKIVVHWPGNQINATPHPMPYHCGHWPHAVEDGIVVALLVVSPILGKGTRRWKIRQPLDVGWLRRA
jgi:hypothetical protein